MDELMRRTGRRCPGCHARLRVADGRCAACGAAVPWRMTGPGLAVEGAAALLAAAGVIAVAVWWSGRGGDDPRVSRSAFEGVISTLPTEPPTFTPTPLAPPSVPPSTPFPPTPTPLPPVIDYSVQSGDTLYGIAIEHGVSLDDILEANADSLDSVHSLSIGQVLRIPIRSAQVADGGEEAAPGGAEGSDEAVAEAPPAGDASGAPSDAGGVTAGTGPTAEPGGADDPAPEPAGSSPEENAGSGAGAPVAPAEPIVLREARTYTIGRGDTLGRIAVEHGVLVEDLVSWNGLAGTDAILSVGESLVIEPAVIATAPPATATPVAAAVQSPRLDPNRVAALPDDEIAERAPDFPAPIEFHPLDGSLVTDETAMLRWASVGRMPPGVYYVVELREIGADPEEIGDVELLWLRSDATGVRVPAEYRPALGARRQLAWRVTIRREGSFLDGRGTVLSPTNGWRLFEWAPGSAGETATAAATPQGG